MGRKPRKTLLQESNFCGANFSFQRGAYCHFKKNKGQLEI